MPDPFWSLPYPSQREPVLARNVVATSQPLAAQAGLEMLYAGGNAVDAAVAAAITLTVVEPTSNGIGSDAFALIWSGGVLHGLNASGRSPRALRPDRFRDLPRIPEIGWDGVTVPGAVSAWVTLSQRLGVLPFARLFEPALRAARRGFLVSRQTAEHWRRSDAIFRGLESFQRTFCPAGRAPRPGERFASPDHARSLELIAATDGQTLYSGELADRLVAHARETGGLIDERDLAEHEPEWVQPISLNYRGFTVHEMPPNGQGLIALMALGMLAEHDVASMPVDTADDLHLQIEAMKLAFADGHRFIADPADMDVAAEDLLRPSYLADRAGRIDPGAAGDPGHGTPKEGGTVYLATADASGMMVSLIQSNYVGFGSGIVVPGTGISLQNRGCCFSLEPGHPNEVGPSKRPYHTIIPGFVTRDAEPVMSFGVMGGFMQPQGHAQMLVRLVDRHQNPQAALDAPRWRVDGGRTVSLEPGFSSDVYQELAARGHDVRVVAERTVAHGGGQIIHRLDDGYLGASDPRRDGQAVGF